MIEKILPEYLFRHLRNVGPYIYFYRCANFYGNDKIIENIYTMSIKYQKLKILEIEWKDHLRYNYLASRNIINNVYLYYDRKLYIKKENPNESELKELFEEAVKCHNNKIENKVENIGKKSKIKNFDEEKAKDEKEKRTIRQFHLQKKKRLKNLLQEKIISNQHQKYSKISYISLNIPHMHKNHNVNLNQIIKNNIINLSINNTNVIKKSDEESLPTNIYNFYNINHQYPKIIIDKFKITKITENLNKNKKDEDIIKLPPKKRYTATISIDSNMQNNHICKNPYDIDKEVNSGKKY